MQESSPKTVINSTLALEKAYLPAESLNEDKHEPINTPRLTVNIIKVMLGDSKCH